MLLGGASRRLGRDKALLALEGEPAAARLSALLGDFCAEVLLVGGSAPEGAFGRSVADPEGPRCALRGLVAALDAARTERVLVVATDLVGLRADLLLGLLAYPAAEVVLPVDGDGSQPLCAAYQRTPVLERARAHLAEGRLALRQLLEALQVQTLEGADLLALSPGGAPFVNVNEEADLARAESLLALRR